MKNLISIGTILLTVATSALGSVFFSVDVGSLQDDAGTPLVEKGMLYLVSSGGDGTFALPETGAIVGAGSDDSIVASWDLSSEVSTVGEYIVSSGEVLFDGAWAQGDSLAILWFPRLTQSDQVPLAGEAYGFYRSADGGGGDAWSMPLDGTFLHSLKFFTNADNPLVDGSDIPSFLAAAAFGAGEEAGAPSINIAGLSTGEPTPGTATFSWSGSTAPGGGYNVERRLVGGDAWSILGTVDGDSTSFDDVSIGRGKDYEYRLVAINGFGSETSAGQSIETLRSNLGNISTRGLLGSGDNVLILGFVVEGPGNIDLLTRTQGPELGKTLGEGFTVASNPRSTLYRGQEVIKVNDDWAETPEQLVEIKDLFGRTIANPNSDEASEDSAMSLQLGERSLYTIISEDVGGGAEGLAIVEVFDAWQGIPNESPNRLLNLSTRGYVGTGDEVLIGGFYINGPVNSRVLLRGIGPDLVARKVPTAIRDPKITLYKGPNPIASNDDWESENAEELVAVSERVGADVLEAGSKDAAMLVTLNPGLYTFIMQGADQGTGIGLVEVFLAD